MQLAAEQGLSFLRTRFADAHFNMVSAFDSYITGLRYFPKADKPMANTIYVCKRDFDNTKYPNSTRVFSDKQAIGYVPKDLAEQLVADLDDYLDSRVLLCFCKSVSTTGFSAPAIYVVFEMNPNEKSGTSEMITSSQPKQVQHFVI
jgi:hypothetical protein